MSSDSRATVVSLLYSMNTLDEARAHLDTVAKNSRGSHHVVVLNGVQSRVADYTWEEIAPRPRVTVVSFPDNMGVARGFNSGISLARTEYVITVASDVTVPADWLAGGWVSAMVDTLEAHGLDSLGTCLNTHEDVPFFRDLNIFCLALTCCCRKTSVYEKIGLFDEQFYPYGFEDEDMGVREHLGGVKRGILMAPDFPIFHRAPDYSKGDSVSDFKLKSNEQNVRRFLEKWQNDSRLSRFDSGELAEIRSIAR